MATKVVPANRVNQGTLELTDWTVDDAVILGPYKVRLGPKAGQTVRVYAYSSDDSYSSSDISVYVANPGPAITHYSVLTDGANAALAFGPEAPAFSEIIEMGGNCDIYIGLPGTDTNTITIGIEQ